MAVRFIAAPEITTTKGRINVNTILNFSTLFYQYVLIFFLFITIARFIPALEVTTPEGEVNANGILNCSTLFLCYNLF